MEAMGVFAEVVEEGFLAFGVAQPTWRPWVSKGSYWNSPVGLLGEGVPAPLGLGAEGDGLAGGYGLEAGDVGGEAELAVADGEGGFGVDGGDDGVVAGD